MAKYLITDSKEIVEEKYLRKMLYEIEIEDLLNYKEDYLKGDMNLDYQFDCIRKAKEADMDTVIYMLETSWNVPVEKIKE